MNFKLYLIAFFIFIGTAAIAQTSSIKGVITDSKTGEKLVGANIHFAGTELGASTDANGAYTITNIRPGSYKITVKYIGYTLYEKQITLAPNQELSLNISIVTSSELLQNVEVVGRLATESEAASRSNEKNSDNIKNVVSAQAIAKSPDINAANVLQRVSGVTIQRNAGGDDAYAIIRGLEPRYNNTLINGIQIASPDNKTRLVSLSVVPSDLLARIEVDKTLTPEMEADAIGGTVNMVFKDAPDKREISATGSIGYNQLFLDRKFVDFSKANINKYSPSEMYGPTYMAQPGDFTRSNLDFKNVQAPPSETFTVSYGERFLKGKLGFIIGNSYQNNYFGSNTEGNIGNADPNDPDRRPRINDIYNRAISSHQILNNLITHFDYKINEKNKIILDNVFLYSRIEEALMNVDTSITGGNGGRTVPGTGPVSITRQSTTTNQYIENLKLSGNHVLDKHFLFDWYGALSDAFVRTPDQAAINSNIAISYDPSTHQYTKTPEYFDNINRTWSHNNDKDFDGAGNITYKTKVKNALVEVKAGGLYRHKTRYNYEDVYILQNILTPGGAKPVFSDIYSVQWTPYNTYGAGTYNVNNYTASENVGAYYGQLKVTLSRLEIFGGVRSESTSQDIHVIQDITNANEITKSYTDVLPSISFKYKLNEITNLRLAYFASIARPAYFELVPTSPPTTGGTVTQGNPDLKHTTSNNYDLRYELFPKADEQIFIGTYYKQLTNPIEYSYVGNSSVIKPVNAIDAKVAGVEVAFTKFIGDFGLSGNYAYNYSDVSRVKVDRLNPQARVVENGMLTGASVHDLNVSFLYRNKAAKINAQVAFQYLGKTLVGIYPDNGDNYIQQPMSVLAFSADKGLSKHFTIFTKMNNLLNTHTTVVLHNFQNGNEITKATYLVGMRYNY
jgi:TonB-dependent receptor